MKILDLLTWDGELSQRGYILFWATLVLLGGFAFAAFYFLPNAFEDAVNDNEFAYYFGMYTVFVVGIFAVMAAVMKRMNGLGMTPPDRATVFLIPINIVVIGALLGLGADFLGWPAVVGETIRRIAMGIVGVMIVGALAFAFYLIGVTKKRNSTI